MSQLPAAAADVLDRIPAILAKDAFAKPGEVPEYAPHDFILGMRVPANPAAWAVHRAMRQAELDIIAAGGEPPTLDDFQKAIGAVEKSKKP